MKKSVRKMALGSRSELLGHIKVLEKGAVHPEEMNLAIEAIFLLLKQYPEIVRSEKFISDRFMEKMRQAFHFALYRAAEYGDRLFIEKVLKSPLKGLDLNAKQEGLSLLQVASQNGHYEILKMLLQSGKITLQDEDKAVLIATVDAYNDTQPIFLQTKNYNVRAKSEMIKILQDNGVAKVIPHFSHGLPHGYGVDYSPIPLASLVQVTPPLHPRKIGDQKRI